ncbi:hypothetical protein BDV95DRAFT_542803 [Massariosphaeria phaeospora]|uniref:Ketoreductase domain-containing protein n=1 Tax=Massariosphaeria phaeospora TaxID=100035 RepID=A0A7C8M9Q2_9PLEO|nr:hypothetical protein BDV95DRAFT_542803 [Massariosphaeria phaeospora]
MSIFQPDPSTFANLKASPKTIVITGGASGIGLATATLLSQLNPQHNLVLIDLNVPPPSFKHDPSRLLVQTCNITAWKNQRAAFEAAYAKFGRIDAVFVNAGIVEYQDQFFTDALDADGQLKEPDRRTLSVDLDAASATTKLAIHYLRKNKEGGQIVLTASLAGYIGSSSVGMPFYCAAKHGIVGLMRAVHRPCRAHHIALSLIAPGITTTPMITTTSILAPAAQGLEQQQAHEIFSKDLAARGVPVNKPETVAAAVCWLFNEGMAASGAGILVQADNCMDWEARLAKTRTQWMGEEMLELYKGGRKVSSLLWEGEGKRAKM